MPSYLLITRTGIKSEMFEIWPNQAISLRIILIRSSNLQIIRAGIEKFTEQWKIFPLTCKGGNCCEYLWSQLAILDQISYVAVWLYKSLVLKLFSCSSQLSMKFSLQINMKIPTYSSAGKFSCSTIFSKTEFAIVSNMRFISRTNFMLRGVEHENNFCNQVALAAVSFCWHTMEKMLSDGYSLLFSIRFLSNLQIATTDIKSRPS